MPQAALDDRESPSPTSPIMDLADRIRRRLRGARPNPRARRHDAAARGVHPRRRGHRTRRAARRPGPPAGLPGSASLAAHGSLGAPVDVAVNLSCAPVRAGRPGGDRSRECSIGPASTRTLPPRTDRDCDHRSPTGHHQQLGRIRDLGVEIGLDDFGTGYASLTHLRRLPLTFVKIDQSFVQGLTQP